MELFGRRIRPLDAAIWAVVGLIVLLGAYLVFSLVTHNLGVKQSTPVSREIVELSALVRANPNNIIARLQLAQSLSMADREDEAIAQYRAVLGVDKDNVTALSGLGFIAAKRGQWDTAEGYFVRVTEILEPSANAAKSAALETAYFYLGDIMFEQKRYEDAIPYYRAALRIKRASSDVHYHLAVAYRETGSPSKYREELEITLAFDPRMPEANYDLGELLSEQGDLAAAAEHFRVAADNAPSVAAPREALEELGPFSDRLAEAEKLSASDATAALAAARIATALEPENAPAQQLAATLYERIGEKDRALAAWRKVASIDESNTVAAEAVRRLSGGE